MGYFIRGTGDAKTPIQHEMEIFKQYILETFFSKMIGKRGSGKPIIINDKLFKGKQAGDTGRFHFVPQNYSDGIEGQNASVTGNEDQIEEFYMDLKIDQVTKAFAKKGKMTDKRTIISLREEFKVQLANWFRWRTEIDMICAMDGRMTDGVTKLTGAALASATRVKGSGRCFRPDYADSKFSTLQVTEANSTDTALLSAMNATDKLNTATLDELQYLAKSANSKYPMKPIRVADGNEYYILTVHPKAAIDLRRDERWEKRAVAALTGNKTLESDPIATGAIGVWEKIIVKEANYINTVKNAAGTVEIARNILLGADAVAMAYAQNLDYTEELRDYRRIMGVAADEIRGIKKLEFDGVDLNIAQLPCAI